MRAASLVAILTLLALAASALAGGTNPCERVDSGTTCHGTSGPDDMATGDGPDRLYGEGGDDRMNGHGGKDYESGGAGADRMHGETGADLLHGGSGADTILGDEHVHADLVVIDLGVRHIDPELDRRGGSTAPDRDRTARLGSSCSSS